MNHKYNPGSYSIRRISAVLLILVMLSGFVIGSLPVAAKTTTISFNEPLILALEGDLVNLKEYSVEFSDGSVTSDVKWARDNSTVTSITVTAPGVITLIATHKEQSQNVYLVAKEDPKDEYVLFEETFDSEDALKGWNKTAADNIYTIKDGKLTIDGLAAGSPRLYLPAWLSDIANYRIDVVGTQTDPTDSNRWFSIMFRAKSVATSGTPYYHMCVRNNMAMPGSSTTGGIELVSNTGTWVYYESTGYGEPLDPKSNYTFTVEAKDDIVNLMVNGNSVIYYDKLPDIANTATGGIGLQANSSKFVVDSIKVTVLESAPEYVKPKAIQRLQYVEGFESNILNSPTNIAIVSDKDALQELQNGQKPSNALMYINGDLDVTDPKGEKIASLEDALVNLSNNIIPAFYIKSKDIANGVIDYFKDKDLRDILMVGDDPELMLYIRETSPAMRTALIINPETETLTADDLSKIRQTVRKANSLIAILPIEHTVTEYVEYLQDLGITVWTMANQEVDDIGLIKMITSGATGLITINYTNVFDLYTEFFKENTLTRTPTIIGHRGNPSQAPENSLSGFLKAIENGSDVVETDVYLTRDNHVIIMHDGTLNRTTTSTLTAQIETLTLEQIKDCNLWGPNNRFKNEFPDEKVPTLEEMIIALKDNDAKIFLEIKSGKPEILPLIAELITKHDFYDRVFVISFNGNQLKGMWDVMPEMGTGLLGGTNHAPGDVEKFHENLYFNIQNTSLHYSTYNPNFSALSEDYIEAMRHRGISLWPWTYSVGSANRFDIPFLAGAGGITTDDAQYSKYMIKKLLVPFNQKRIDPDGSTEFEVQSITYQRKTRNILSDKTTEIHFLNGEDVISIEDGTIKALKEGVATFIISTATRTVEGADYVLYTQPITITVGEEAVEDSDESSASTGSSFPWYIAVIIALVILIASVILVFVFRKNKTV